MLNRHPDPTPTPPAPVVPAAFRQLEWADVKVPLPRALSAMVRLPRPTLPPAAELRPHDDTAADLLEGVRALERAESDAAQRWQSATRWSDALVADAAWTVEQLRATGAVPPPDEGPMAEHHWTLEAALTTAWRAGVAVDVARQDLASHVARSTDLRDDLTRRRDALHAEAQDLLLRARDHKDHRAWFTAREDVAPTYWRTDALLAWVLAPHTGWRVEWTTVTPHDLGALWSEAESVITERPLLDVPERSPGAPPRAPAGTLPGEKIMSPPWPPVASRPVGG